MPWQIASGPYAISSQYDVVQHVWVVLSFAAAVQSPGVTLASHPVPAQITALMILPHKDALLRPMWNQMHHWNGRLILLLSLVNIWEGMSLLHPAMPVWPFLYAAPLGLLVVTASILEAFLIWRWVMDDTPQSDLQVHYICIICIFSCRTKH